MAKSERRSLQMTIDEYLGRAADEGLREGLRRAEESETTPATFSPEELSISVNGADMGTGFVSGKLAVLMATFPKILFERLHDSATLPTKAHPSDSGFDLYASEDVIIEPGETKVIPTGIAVGLPQGTEAQVRPRSGITSKTKLRVQLGTIDNGYTGEVGVIVDNINANDLRYILCGVDGREVSSDVDKYYAGSYLIRKGDKIAQLVVQYLPQFEAVEVTELEDSQRGSNGFGSSGT